MFFSRLRLALSSLLALAASWATAQNPRPAFLDARDRIRLSLERPIDMADLSNSYEFSVEGQRIAVKEVRPAGEPVRERLLPQINGRFVLAGTIQSALGAREWDPDGEVTQMREFAPGMFELVVQLPKGRYDYKAARNGSWQENYGAGYVAGGQNISIVVPKDGQIVRFVVDTKRKLIMDSINQPMEVTAPDKMPRRPDFANAPKKFEALDLILERPVSPADVGKRMVVVRVLEDTIATPRTVIAREVLSDTAFQYDGDDLGARYSKSSTSFKVWSPVSRQAELVLYRQATGGQPVATIAMQRNANGVWSTEVKGDLHGTFYVYRFESYEETRTATDIYSFAANRDSTRSMVIDLSRTNPAAWATTAAPKLRQFTDSIIYELHVRDFTVDASSGVDAAKRGKYAGMVQRGTKVPGASFRTGLDYMVDLGVTDVHLLPVQNFLLSHEGDYTWGYATNLFNVPEESYAVSPNDPVAVIREYKEMVRDMHKAGLRVVMDVVYNHTWPPDGKDSNFWQTVPYYYFRTNDRGEVLNESGVGNALHDERPMVRKFVRDSLLFWMNEYKIDGFRFDLIGMHTRDSVVDWTRAMRKVKPDVTLYGEPWTGGGPVRFGKDTQRGTGMAVFNDRFRGAFRGELDGPGAGFVSGGKVEQDYLRKAITGWIDTPGQKDGFTDAPTETINYVSAHDNATLWDKLALVNADPRQIERSVRLTGAAVLLSQGIPFLEGGAQIGRTKGGNNNSYNAGDAVNKYDWARATKFSALNDYYRGLIALRKSAPEFRLASAAEVRDRLQFVSLSGNRVAWTVGSYFVILNGETTAGKVSLPAGTWDVLVDDQRAGTVPLRQGATGEIELTPLSAYVFRKAR
jgi:pullulanase